jgi:uncharacterized membrane protein YfhO
MYKGSSTLNISNFLHKAYIKCSMISLTSPTHFAVVIFQIGSHIFFPVCTQTMILLPLTPMGLELQV